jgi:hypothetical protein
MCRSSSWSFTRVHQISHLRKFRWSNSATGGPLGPSIQRARQWAWGFFRLFGISGASCP